MANGPLLGKPTHISYSSPFRQRLVVLNRQDLGGSTINSKVSRQASSLQLHASQGLVKLILIRCFKATNPLKMVLKDKSRVCG